MIKDKVKSIIYNIKGRPNFNGYRGTIYESKYKKYFLYNGAEKAFKENDDNKMILDTENNKLYINGTEFTDNTFNQLDVDKPIPNGILCWLDGYDKNPDLASNRWISRVGNVHGVISGVVHGVDSGWQDDGTFKFDGVDDVVTIETGNIYSGDFTIQIQYSETELNYLLDSIILTLSNKELYLELYKNINGSLKLHIAGDTHHVYNHNDNIICIAKSGTRYYVYNNGIKIHEYDYDIAAVSDKLLIGGMGTYASFKLKSIVLYDRCLTMSEIKHNYLYERYYRHHYNAVDLNVRPLVQEVGLGNGISKPIGFDKPIMLNSDGTFNNIDNSLSGQIVRHVVSKRIVAKRNISMQHDFKLNNVHQMVVKKISNTSFRLTKNLSSSVAGTISKYTGTLPANKIYTVSFNVIKCIGVWKFIGSSFSMVIDEELESPDLVLKSSERDEIQLGLNRFHVTVDDIEHIYGFLNIEETTNGELIIDNYKCEEGVFYTGLNDTEYDIYEEEYVEGLYKGPASDNLITKQNNISIYANRGYVIDSGPINIDGWNEIIVSGNDLGDIAAFIYFINIPLVGGNKYSASIELDMGDYRVDNISINGSRNVGNMTRVTDTIYKIDGFDVISDGNFNIHIPLKGTLYKQKIRWRNAMLECNNYSTPYVNFNRNIPYVRYNIPIQSGITADILTFYSELYNILNKKNQIKFLYINGNHLLENSDKIEPNITNHSAYSSHITDPYILDGTVRNIIFIYKKNIYMNGCKLNSVVNSQTNYNTNMLSLTSFAGAGVENDNAALFGVSTRNEVFKTSDLPDLTEQDCINISKYGLKRWNEGRLIPMREVEKL